jgi:stearoyl-CoA desaturase (delta-9 desaturase)
MLVAVAGVIHDVTGFVEDHPGGKSLIKSVVGKDATGVFNGGVYEHSNAAHNLLATMQVVAVWKRQRVDMLGKGEILKQVTRVERLVEGAVAA